MAANQAGMTVFPLRQHGIQQPRDIVDTNISVTKTWTSIYMDIHQHFLLAVSQTSHLHDLSLDVSVLQISFYCIEHPQRPVRSTTRPRAYP
jgi:hypothetical protein